MYMVEGLHKHFCILSVAETFEQHRDEHCKRVGAKERFFCSFGLTPTCYVHR